MWQVKKLKPVVWVESKQNESEPVYVYMYIYNVNTYINKLFCDVVL